MAPKAAVVVFSSSTMVLVPIELHVMQKETLCWPYILLRPELKRCWTMSKKTWLGQHNFPFSSCSTVSQIYLRRRVMYVVLYTTTTVNPGFKEKKKLFSLKSCKKLWNLEPYYFIIDTKEEPPFFSSQSVKSNHPLTEHGVLFCSGTTKDGIF